MWRRFLSAIGGLFSPLGPDDFVIIYHPDRPLVVRGTLTKAKIPGVATFFARDLKLKGPTKVIGKRSRLGLQVRFSGAMTRMQAQRARNFLIEHLR